MATGASAGDAAERCAALAAEALARLGSGAPHDGQASASARTALDAELRRRLVLRRARRADHGPSVSGSRSLV